MTYQAKKPLYNSTSLIILLFLIGISFAFSLAGKVNFNLSSIFTFLSLAIFIISHKIKLNVFHKFRSKREAMEEKLNLISENVRKTKERLKTLPGAAERVDLLFNISQKLIEIVDPQEVFSFLIDTCSRLFIQADNILLFSLPKHSFKLVRSLSRQGEIIKEKRGDVLDEWVVRHNLPLMLEDLISDFRFNYKKVVAFKERDIHSLIASPLSLENRIMGIIRVESRKPSAFSLDDSRILHSICNLGALVLERANFFKRTHELAIKDSLTSLFSKDYFFSRLKDEIIRSVLKKKGLGIIMLDIDDFKKINDTYGHIVGDLVLKKLARILQECARDAGNSICRFGGEEFILFIVECGRKRLADIGEDIRRKAEGCAINFRRKSVNFTLSLGAVLCPDDGRELLGLIDKADQLLYQAKREGKNRLCMP